MPTPSSRVAFSIFGIDIMWYGILITLGMAAAAAIAYKRAPRHGIPSERILDTALVCLPAAIVGARLYYVLFHWENYAGDFFKIINIRSGGLAIHGGLLFGMIAGVLLCFLWKIRPLNGLDLVVPGIALAQAIGRWGNYFNGEAHGGPTTLPWAIIVDGQAVHPTFLYESIWCLLLFFILLAVDNRRKFAGQTFLLYGILYSFERFFVEGLRTDSLMIGDTLRAAQVVSAVVFVTFTIWYRILRKKNSKKGLIFYPD